MKRISAFFRRLFREIFYGGNEYKTVKGKKTPFPLGIVCSAALITVLLLVITFLIIRISDTSAELSAMRKEVVTLEDKEKDLRDELEHKYPFVKREDAAKELGFSAENSETVILPPSAEETASDAEGKAK